MKNLDNILKANYLLPPEFIKKWSEAGENDKFQYLDFASDITMDVFVENEPFIQKLFSTDPSFDGRHIEKQFRQIAKAAKAILDVRIYNKSQIKLTSHEVLFLKYFYFLMSYLNGDYKFFFESRVESYRIFDVFSNEVEEEVKHDILLLVNYVLFELYDSLFTNRPFDDLLQYVQDTGINFTLHEFNKRIVVPMEDFKNQNYRFIDAYFHNLINNTFLKFFEINELDRNRFMLTNKTIANFIEEKSKANILSVMIIDPRYAIGLINMGPGRGEYRPMFKFFQNNIINKELIPSCLYPEHEIIAEDLYLDTEQRFFFTPFELTVKQINLINECMTYRTLKYDFVDFSKV